MQEQWKTEVVRFVNEWGKGFWDANANEYMKANETSGLQESMHEEVNESMNEGMNQEMNQQDNEWMNEWMNQSIDRSIIQFKSNQIKTSSIKSNQSINDWTNKWLNEWKNEMNGMNEILKWMKRIKWLKCRNEMNEI